MNLNYLFYHKYFDFLADEKAPSPAEMNAAITRATVKTKVQADSFGQTFYMKTTYPGLLIGIGNAHDAANEANLVKDAVKLGFALDYVTGLPVIPGSTVKGVLRSAFSEHPEYVKEKLEEVTGDARWAEMSNETLKKIENEMFGDKQNPNTAKQDVFFEAVPVKAGAGSRLLGEDFVTSHKGDTREMDGLVEPNPVRMLKVLPGVVFAFRFQCLLNEIDGYCMTPEVKVNLFAGILEDLGIGAKTNTGYGNMVTVRLPEEEQKYILEIDKVEIRKRV